MKNNRHNLGFYFATNLLLFMILILGGCGKSGVDAKQEDAGLPPEAVAVRKAFESSSPSYKNPVKEALNLVKAGSVNRNAYAEVIPQLQKLASNPTISAEQKQALEALVEKLKGELSTGEKRINAINKTR